MLKPIVWCLNAFQTTERTIALLSNPIAWWWNSKIRWWDISISPNSVSTLRGSYGRCKGRCTIRVLQLVHGILPVNSRIKCFLLAQTVGRDLGPPRFTCKFSHKVLCAMSKCIFTAQARTNCGSRSWSAACKFSHKMARCATSMCISTAQAHTKRVTRSWSSAFNL
jgi:hypothetical protein